MVHSKYSYRHVNAPHTTTITTTHKHQGLPHSAITPPNLTIPQPHPQNLTIPQSFNITNYIHSTSEVFALVDNRKNITSRMQQSIAACTRAQTLTRTYPCATCIWLLYPAPTSAQNDLAPLQLALVVFSSH